MQGEEEFSSYFTTSSPLQMILGKIDKSKISMMRIPLRILAFSPFRVSLLRYVKEQFSSKHWTRNRSKLFVFGGVIIVAFIVAQRRKIHRALTVSSNLTLVRSAAQLTSDSTKILRDEVSQKSISIYRYVISLVCNLLNKFHGAIKISDDQQRQSDISSIKSLVRTRTEKLLQFFRIIQGKPPAGLNLEETVYNQVEAICDLLEVLLMQRDEPYNQFNHAHNLKASPVGHSRIGQQDKVLEPLESNDYNIHVDKENSPCNAYEKLNNAISLTERLTRDLATFRKSKEQS
ncbi:hypothetical protein Gasu2_66790 [Galdieria sulphuraria]|uniref:Uncharacterized protein n=1 Tax=Galdieria sulphuraria TaxID=130081 RepID=M2XT77_GALSU|nr:uncharacterized protein Gasu_55250 [Galdieria sulphuraria]EME26838.1 hypothetical protein Gasu_55250 [Galdieria sulphuraria]GJD12604.1 hypothetical protein Gasu2_66790 [Galdieria sulphuraria]|eukprot:XP_005703358.1 hypothetical protein Gasu_55250 [Galdieria sulphuraria]